MFDVNILSGCPHSACCVPVSEGQETCLIFLKAELPTHQSEQGRSPRPLGYIYTSKLNSNRVQTRALELLAFIVKSREWSLPHFWLKSINTFPIPGHSSGVTMGLGSLPATGLDTSRLFLRLREDKILHLGQHQNSH